MQRPFLILLIILACVVGCGSPKLALSGSGPDSTGSGPFPVTASESAAGISAVDTAYVPGDVRRYGAVGDGRADDTRALQAALDSGSEQVTIARPPEKYMTDQLLVRSNTDILLEPGTILEANPGYSRNDVVLLLRDVRNVRISGSEAIIQMPKSEYSGEFNHGVSIRGSTNIEVEGLTSRNTGGDGFYVGAGRGANTFSENVVLKDIKADNNRRQGLSIVSVKRLRVLNPRLINTSGTRPASAIDIEPNDNSNFLEDIVIDHPYSADNQGNGYNIYLKELPGPTDKQVSITINDAIDERSASSFVVGKLDTRGFNVDGFIRFNRSTSIESRAMAYVARNYDARGPKIEFRQPVAIRPNTDAHRSTKYGSAMVVFRNRSDVGPPSIGNVHFYDPEVRDDRPVPKTRHYFHIRDLTGKPTENVSINGTIRGVGVVNAAKMVQFDGAGSVEDRGGLLVHHIVDRDHSLSIANYSRTITNRGSTRPVTARLGKVPANWPSVTFEVHAATALTVQPMANGVIVADNGARYRQVGSTEVGATLTLRHTGAGNWRVESQTGNWSSGSDVR